MRKDGFMWVFLVLLVWEGSMSWPVGLVFALLLLNHAVSEFHLAWYRHALTTTQAMLSHSLKGLEVIQAEKWQETLDKDRKEFN